jgi:hypothetical protein
LPAADKFDFDVLRVSLPAVDGGSGVWEREAGVEARGGLDCCWDDEAESGGLTDDDEDEAGVG